MFCFWFRPGVPAVMPMDLSFHFLLLSIPPEPAQTSSFFLFLPSLHQKPHLIRHVRLCWKRDPGTIQTRDDPSSWLSKVFHPAASLGFCSTNVNSLSPKVGVSQKAPGLLHQHPLLGTPGYKLVG